MTARTSWQLWTTAPMKFFSSRPKLTRKHFLIAQDECGGKTFLEEVQFVQTTLEIFLEAMVYLIA